MPVRVRQLPGLLGWLLLTPLAAIWMIGYAVAPRHHPQLASVRLGKLGDETALSGARFACGWDRARAAQHCEGSLEELELTVTFSQQTCSARWGGSPLTCRLDYGAAPGLPSVRIATRPLHSRSPSLAALVDVIGTLSECEWGFLSELTLLSLLVLVMVTIWRRAPSLALRWGYSTLSIALVPVLLLALFFFSGHMGYAD